MRLWTIQPQIVYEILQSQGVFHCNPKLSDCITQFGFTPYYDWLIQQMRQRIGSPPPGVTHPIWAWHTMDWKHQKPDLRRIEFRNYPGPQVCIELEIPDQDVLLSDEERWHIVLNNGYYGDAKTEAEMDTEDAWFESLPQDEQEQLKKKSWEKIFNVNPPYEDSWERRGCYIQATFWELRMEQVVSVRHFKGWQSTDRT